MVNDVLYEKGRVKITYLHSPESGKEDEIVSGEDHELWIKGRDGEWNRYIIQRGILEELSRAASDKSKLTEMLNRINLYVLRDMRREGIALEDVGQAVSGARQKIGEEFERWLSEQT